MSAALAVAVLGASGCVRQSEYDAKVTELHKQTDKTAKAEKQAAQLQKDLDAAKSEVKKGEQARDDLEAKVKSLEQTGSGLKDQVSTLEEKNRKLLANADEKTSQLQKDLAAAQNEARKAEETKKDAEAKLKTLEQENADLKNRGKKRPGVLENLSGAWQITYRQSVLAVQLEGMGSNNYRLTPPNIAFSGIYLFDGASLSLVGENTQFPNLVWSLKQPGLFEMKAGPYAGATMKRQAPGGPNSASAKP
jgi:septal ring factor EnvC (AmiA/AmiB activator)